MPAFATDLPRWSRRVLVAIAALAILSSAWIAMRSRYLLATLGGQGGDMVSHAHSAVIWTQVGFDIYRVPTKRLQLPTGRRMDDADYLGLLRGDQEGDIHAPGRPRTQALERVELEEAAEPSRPPLPGGEQAGKRPLFTNWREAPRVYPPGCLVYFAPEAFLYEHTGLSLHAINVISMIKVVLMLHALFALLVLILFLGAPDWTPVAFMLPIFYASYLYWTLGGVYDGVAIASVLLAIRALARQRSVEALAWMSLAIFLHFRALWYAPLLVAAAWAVATDRAWLRRPRDVALVIASAVMLAVSLVVLVLVYDGAAQLRRIAPFASWFDLGNVACASYWSMAVLLIAYLIYARSWWVLGAVAWQAVLMMQAPQLQPWHTMFLLPLLAIARWRREGPGVAVALCIYIFATTHVAFAWAPWPGNALVLILGGKI